MFAIRNVNCRRQLQLFHGYFVLSFHINFQMFKDYILYSNASAGRVWKGQGKF